MLARMISLNQIRDTVSHPVLRLLLENGMRSYHFLSDNFKKALIALIFTFKVRASRSEWTDVRSGSGVVVLGRRRKGKGKH